MNGGQLIAALTGLTALIGAATGIISILVIRRGQRETTKAKERVDSFEMMKELVDALRASLTDANVEATVVQAKLDEAERRVERLNLELNIALANVGILTSELTKHNLPIPSLRRPV